MDSLTAKVTAEINWTAKDQLTGTNYGETVNTTRLNKQVAYVSTVADAVLGGAKELYSTILSIAGGGNTVLDLENLTNILGATIDFARIKAIMIRLLSTADDATNGTAATAIEIDNTTANALSSQSNSGWFSNANEGTATGGAGDATGSQFTIPNGGGMLFWTNNAGGIVVDGTHSDLKIVNLDGAVTAKVEVTIIGGTA